MRRTTIDVSLVLVAALSFGLGGCKQSSGGPTSGGIGGKGDGQGSAAGAAGRSPNASGGAVAQWTEAGPMWVADWTLLVYAANDDKNHSLVSAFDDDMQELRTGLGGSAMFRIVVQRDYAAHQLDGNNQPRPSERYGLYREQRFNPETMKLEDPATGETGTISIGETDTANHQTLRDFLVYGIRKFPAKRYWVIITGHGDGFGGLAFDASTGPKERLPVSGLVQALAEAGQHAQQVKDEIIRAGDEQRPVVVDGRPFVLGNRGIGSRAEQLDVIQFDACHMGNLETATAVSPYVDYMIASQEVMPNAGHPYMALRHIAQDRTGSAGGYVTQSVVTDYVRAYVDGASTMGRSYVGKTVSSIGLKLWKLKAGASPMHGKLANFVSKVKAHHHPEGFSCQEVHALAQAAKQRANLVGHVIERPSDNGRCAGAEQLALQNGKVMIRGDIGEFSDEFAGLKCSGGAALAGPQVYYRIDGQPDRTYQITVNTDFEGGEAYVFTSAACSQSTIQADCQSNGVGGASTGALVRRRPGSLTFSPATEGPFYVVVDSAGGAGKFILAVQESAGRATSATNASVDLVALFETVAGFDKSRRNAGIPGYSCNYVDHDPYPPTGVQLAEEVKEAARELLVLIDRPHVFNPLELKPRADGSVPQCGATSMFGGQYRRLTSFDGDSPFVAEAHKIEVASDTTRRAPGMSLLFGDIYPMTGNGDFAEYVSLPLEQQVGWTGVMQRCVNEVMACRNWNGQGQNPCLALPF